MSTEHPQNIQANDAISEEVLGTDQLEQEEAEQAAGAPCNLANHSNYCMYICECLHDVYIYIYTMDIYIYIYMFTVSLARGETSTCS